MLGIKDLMMIKCNSNERGISDFIMEWMINTDANYIIHGDEISYAI